MRHSLYQYFVGHCPHHESPNAVNELLSAFVSKVESSVRVPSLVSAGSSSNNSDETQNDGTTQDEQIPKCELQNFGEEYNNKVFTEMGGREVRCKCVDGSPRTWLEKLGAIFHERELGLA